MAQKRRRRRIKTGQYYHYSWDHLDEVTLIKVMKFDYDRYSATVIVLKPDGKVSPEKYFNCFSLGGLATKKEVEAVKESAILTLVNNLKTVCNF
ncbi:MAG: hypothetical protein AAB358_03050 [Patescibacteria group bacterium]